jgi:hypothetical protein
MEAPQRDESLLAFPVIANHCQHLKAGLAAFLDGPYRAQGIRLACSEGRAAEAHQHCFRPDRAALASARLTSAYRPIEGRFSMPWMRCFQRHRFEPLCDFRASTLEPTRNSKSLQTR